MFVVQSYENNEGRLWRTIRGKLHVFVGAWGLRHKKKVRVTIKRKWTISLRWRTWFWENLHSRSLLDKFHGVFGQVWPPRRTHEPGKRPTTKCGCLTVISIYLSFFFYLLSGGRTPISLRHARIPWNLYRANSRGDSRVRYVCARV